MQEIKQYTSRRRSDCPISFSLDIFGDKWTLMILRDIMFYHRIRFSDFMPQERIATNILADRLTKLERLEIIRKQRDTRLNNQYIYSVTSKGEALLPLLIEMTLWGLEYDPKSLASKEFIEHAQSDKQKVIREISRSIKRGEFTDYRSKKMGINPQIPALPDSN
ncbi:MAG TPA: helix-turn-helix domain-containing protein [Patescibacteria group bacterium]|nr:helix-turn-helix domain-containing protein [Patescibacteria group bacterium]